MNERLTADTTLRKSCYKGSLKKREENGEYIHGVKKGDFFFEDGKYSLTTQTMICILTRSPSDSYISIFACSWNDVE